jgi:hypothetical protein
MKILNLKLITLINICCMRSLLLYNCFSLTFPTKFSVLSRTTNNYPSSTLNLKHEQIISSFTAAKWLSLESINQGNLGLLDPSGTSKLTRGSYCSSSGVTHSLKRVCNYMFERT